MAVEAALGALMIGVLDRSLDVAASAIGGDDRR
jgi:hypothetical protein